VADTRFVRAIDALYAVLDLPAPLRGEVDETHVLLAGDTQVTIALAPNGRAAIVSAPVGHLPGTDPLRAEKGRTLLKASLALMRSNAAAIVFDGPPAADGSRAVRASARASLEEDSLVAGERLKLAIEDVLDLVEIHTPTLSGGSQTIPLANPRAAADTAAAGAETLIFRP